MLCHSSSVDPSSNTQLASASRVLPGPSASAAVVDKRTRVMPSPPQIRRTLEERNRLEKRESIHFEAKTTLRNSLLLSPIRKCCPNRRFLLIGFKSVFAINDWSGVGRGRGRAQLHGTTGGRAHLQSISICISVGASRDSQRWFSSPERLSIARVGDGSDSFVGVVDATEIRLQCPLHG